MPSTKQIIVIITVSLVLITLAIYKLQDWEIFVETLLH